MTRKSLSSPDILAKIHALLLRLVSPLPPVPVQGTDRVVLLRPEQICFATPGKDKNGVQIVDAAGQSWPRYDNLLTLEKRLAEDPRFYRSHRSYLVNVERIRAVNGTTLYFQDLPDDITAQVSAGNLSGLKKLLGM